MTWRHLALGAALMTVLTTPVLTQNPAADLQRAMQKEAATGDCKLVLTEYERIARQGAKADRATTADALLRMAMCHEQNQDGRALPVYREIAKDFTDQDEAVARANERIRALTGLSTRQALPGPFRQTSADTRVGFNSTISPDGTLALEMVGESFATGLVERSLETNSQRVLWSFERDGPRPPAAEADLQYINGPFVWSPDSSRVAFRITTSKQGKPTVAEIRSLNRLTGEMRTLTAWPEMIQGTAEWTTRGDVLCWRQGASAGVEYFLVPSAGGEPRRVLERLQLSVPYAPFGDKLGDLFPDGSKAIIVRSGRLSIVDLATGVEEPLTLSIGAAVPRVSPDGRLVAFVSKQNGGWALYVAPLETRPIRNPIKVTDLDPELIEQPYARPTWRKSSTLSFDHEVGGLNVYRIEIDPQTVRPKGAPERLSHQIPGGQAWISPDGRRVAYRSRANRLVVMDSDGGLARLITDGAVRLDGWRGADEVLVASGASQVQVLNLSTGVVSDLAFAPAQVGPTGVQYVEATQELFFGFGGKLIARSQVDGKERVVGPARQGWRVSRDGMHIAAGTEDLTITRINRDGAETPVGSLKAPEGGPVRAWSPNGSHLIYEGRELRILNLASMQSWALTDPEFARRTFGPDVAWDWYGEASWSPDGSFVVASGSHRRRIRLTFEGVTAEAVAKLSKATGPRQP